MEDSGVIKRLTGQAGDIMFQDVRYALRSLARNRTFSLTALLALALGIGATTAIFTVVNRTILRPLPFANADRLVQLYGTPVERGEAIATADLEEFRTAATPFETLAGYNIGARYLQGREGLERVMTVDVERAFFSTLGVEPMLGRTFQPGDPVAVAVAGEAFWRRALGADPAAVGRTILVNEAAYTVIGVMPESFQFPYGAASLLAGVASQARTDLWTLREPAPGQPRTGRQAAVIGRLKPNVAVQSAESELAVLMTRLEDRVPQRTRGLGIRVVPLSLAVVPAPVRRSLFLLFGAAAVVLLLACANVTNLWLVRAMARSRDVATRVALGASPLRLIREFLIESLLLALAGGLAGLVLAAWSTAMFMRVAAAHLPRSHETGMDWRVFALSLGLCLLSGLLFGLAQLFSVIRRDTHAVLREGTSRHTMSAGQGRLRDGLVILEVALAFVLGVGATLLIRELVRLRNTDSGMVTENVLTIHVGQQMTRATDARQFYDIADRVRQTPGVEQAGFIQVLPLQNWGWSSNTDNFPFRGRTNPSVPAMQLRYVTPGYFDALGIRMNRGRGFTAADSREAPPVIVVNETLARLAFGEQDPIGQVTTRGTVIGILSDVRQVNLDQPSLPEIYFPAAQNWSQVGELGMTLAVRTAGSPAPLVDAIRARIHEVNPALALFDIKTMDRVVSESMADFLLYLSLMFAFAGVALFMAFTGTYGVVSYIATVRTREFAIRTALGAQTGQLAWLVLWNGVRLAVVGIAFGLMAVLAAAPLLRNLPMSVRPPDGAIMVPAAVLIGAAAILSCLIPARRASAADPMAALRND